MCVHVHACVSACMNVCDKLSLFLRQPFTRAVRHMIDPTGPPLGTSRSYHVIDTPGECNRSSQNGDIAQIKFHNAVRNDSFMTLHASVTVK